MLRNRTTISQIVIALTGLLVGVAFGHWVTRTGVSADSAAVRESQAKAAPHAQKSKDVNSGAGATELVKSSANSAVARKSLEEILKGRNSRDRTSELEQFVGNLQLSEFGAALKRLRQMPEGNARDLASRLLIARWAELDPNGALQFALQNHEFDYIASDVFQQLAADDLPGALERAKSIPDMNMRYQALRGVLSIMADKDPLGALKLAGTFGPFLDNEPLSQMIYRQWSAMDPQAAAAQAAQDPSGTGWRSPMGQVLRNWATQDPLAAMNWAISLNSDAQGREVGQVMRQWSREDLSAAVNWINSIPASGTRDAAVAGLAYAMVGGDPQTAISWAMTMTDAAQRNEVLSRLSRQVVYRDPTNGPPMLQAAGVPANLIPPPPAAGDRRGWRGR